MEKAKDQYRYLRISIYVFSALVLLSSFGWLHWTGDLLKLFLDYFILILLVAVGFAFWYGLWPVGILGVSACVLGGILLFSFSAESSYVESQSAVRLLVHNLYYENEEVAAVLAEISRQNPDIIYLMEYPSNANPVMRLDLADEYPYQIVEPSRFTMGVALFSKHPIIDSQVHQFQGTRIPIIEAQLEVDGDIITFVGGHPWPPLPRWGQRHRDQIESMINVAANVDQTETPLIVAGDFNTPQSAYMLRQLSAEADVTQVRRRFDMRKTFNLFPLVGFSLDHVFVSKGLGVVDSQYGSMAGSDHVSIVVDFALLD